MTINKRFDSVGKSIAFMAIMAAINVIFVLLTTFVPFLLFVLVFILPLSCTFVVLMCPKKYFIIYAFATIGLCLIVTIYNISDTLFFIIPSIITGFVFAVCVEQRVNYAISIILASFVQFGLSYAALPLIKLITQVDLLKTIEEAFKITQMDYLEVFEFLAVFLVSFVQEVISYLVIRYGLQKLNYRIEDDKNSVLLLIAGLLINLFCATLFVTIKWSIFAVFLFTSLYFGVFLILWIAFLRRKYNYFILGGLTIIAVFLFALIYNQFGKQASLLVIIGHLFSILIIAFVNNWLVKTK